MQKLIFDRINEWTGCKYVQTRTTASSQKIILSHFFQKNILQIFKPAGEEKLIEQTLNEIKQKYSGF